MVEIDIMLCTFRRASLAETLESLGQQVVPEGLRVRLIVVDNDNVPSAEGLVARFWAPFPIVYIHAPAGNISVARNAGLEAARADWVAFLDDDECAPPGWIAALWHAAEGVDAVFGPAVAVYPTDAPGWMRAGDYHSNRPVVVGGQVRTGHTCNALLRWRGAPWEGCRFDLARGRSGGEDTAFFHEVARLGAEFRAAPEAPVQEPVAPARLTLRWLLARRYRMGQSHVSSVVGAAARAALAAQALTKAAVCGAAMLALAWNGAARRFWLLRGALHCGVVAGCLGRRQATLYGG